MESELHTKIAEAYGLPVEEFDPSEIIGTDTLDSGEIQRIKKEAAAGEPQDPVILYEHNGTRFILEGNQRSGKSIELGEKVRAVSVSSEQDFQKVRSSGIKLGNVAKYKTLAEAVAALASHLRDTRHDVYMKYFNQVLG